MIEQRDREYMEMAFALAKEAAEDGEVPVGAVLVFDGKVAGVGRNRRQVKKNALCHAEIEAIDNACRNLGGWRLHKGELYVTLEPCPMCAGAAVNAHVERIVFGAEDEVMGACGTAVNVVNLPRAFKPEIYRGLMAEVCAELLREFFSDKRR